MSTLYYDYSTTIECNTEKSDIYISSTESNVPPVELKATVSDQEVNDDQSNDEDDDDGDAEDDTDRSTIVRWVYQCSFRKSTSVYMGILPWHICGQMRHL